ncbi:MAG TPA: GEVED domain-containing protein, partial [Chitinophagales bacterium]|nr:GEVED domain-containing protein [Chitinophagales bacterium]
DPVDLFAFQLTAAGSTNFTGDVSNVKIYYTAVNPVFSTAVLFGSSADLSTPVYGAVTLNTGINYFWVTYDVSPTATLGNYVDVTCSQLQFTGATGNKIPAVTDPAGSRQVGYCTASSIYGCGNYYIDGVVLNTLSNVLSNCNGAANGYINYPATGTATTALEIGSNYPITLTGPPDFSYAAVGFGVWIDFNNDGYFDDADEFVFSSPAYSTGVQSGLITIPNNAAYTGERRMRIRARDYSVISSTESCTAFYGGETEDYTITIVPASPMVFSAVTAFQNNLSAVELGTADAEIAGLKIQTNGSLNPFSLTSVTFNANGSTNFAGDVSGIKVYYTGSDPNFSAATLYGSATNLSLPITGSVALTGGANYFWLAYDISATATLGNFVDAECVAVTLSGTGGTHVPDVTSPEGNREINYCVGTYVNECTSDDYIDNFTFNTLSNLASGCNGNPDNYIFYNPDGNLTTTVLVGGTYDLSLQSGSAWNQGFGVWIDFNNDGSFGGADEFIYASPTYGTDWFYATITLPNVASYIGQHRLRVRCSYNSTVSADGYCSEINYGETEDYTITIDPQPPCTGTPEPGTLTITPDEFCITGTTASLALTNYQLASNIVLEWQQSSNGSSWSVIPGVTAYSYTTPGLSATSYYRIKVTCTTSGQSAYTNSAVITLNPAPASPSGIDGLRCGPGAVVLNANGSGGNLLWYDQLTGGNYLGTGSPFTTPYITTATDFYVEESGSAGCSSLRTTVHATIYYPNIAASASDNSICAGETINLNAQNNGQGTFNYQWGPLLSGMIPSNGQAATVTVPPAVSTTFTVTATEATGQCDTSVTVSISVLPAPVVQLSGLSNTYEVVASPVTLSGTPSGGTFSGTGVTGNIFDPAAAGVGGPYVITYTYTDANGCMGVDTEHVTVTFPIGINEQLVSEQLISIYPNPGEGVFVLDIHATAAISRLNCRVMNVVGQVLFEEALNLNSKVFKKSYDFSQWSKGTYYFEMEADGRLIRKKLVIQ